MTHLTEPPMSTARTLLLLLAITLAGPACTPTTPSPETFDVGMLRVERTGRQGQTAVILIPGLFSGAWAWEREAALLAPSYDVYTLTLPGFDGRARDDDDSLMTRAAAAIAELLRTRRLDHPVIVGHSLGGTLAVLFAETYPDQAGAIIAVEGGRPIAPTAAEREQQIKASVAPYVGIPDSAFGPVLRREMLQYIIRDSAEVDRVERLAARSDRIAVIRWMQEAEGLDLSPDLRRITVPLTAIIPFDAVIDPYQGFTSEGAKRDAYVEWLAPAPRGSVVMIPNARHFVMFDQPAAFDRALLEAIAATTKEM